MRESYIGKVGGNEHLGHFVPFGEVFVHLHGSLTPRCSLLLAIGAGPPKSLVDGCLRHHLGSQNSAVKVFKIFEDSAVSEPYSQVASPVRGSNTRPYLPLFFKASSLGASSPSSELCSESGSSGSRRERLPTEELLRSRPTCRNGAATGRRGGSGSDGRGLRADGSADKLASEAKRHAPCRFRLSASLGGVSGTSTGSCLASFRFLVLEPN